MSRPGSDHRSGSTPRPAVDAGPFAVEPRRALLDALDPHRAARPHEHAALIAQWLRVQLDAAGVERGAHDERVLAWLAGWEPETVQVIAGWVRRAAAEDRP